MDALVPTRRGERSRQRDTVVSDTPWTFAAESGAQAGRLPAQNSLNFNYFPAATPFEECGAFLRGCRGVPNRVVLSLCFAAALLGVEAPGSAQPSPASVSARPPHPPAGGPANGRNEKAAAAGDPIETSLGRFRSSIERRTLPNGLRLVLDPDHTVPTVAVSVTYDVGSSAEEAGRTGFAHLFEHMMFQGSKHAGKGEHFKLVSERGGTLNGTTDTDRTNFFEVLPRSELELALWLEADRMRWLDVTPANFENQRAVVEEEYRMRVLNQPYATGAIRLSELVFAHYAPYAHPTIGSMADLDAARFEWVKAFHERFYTPDHAVLAIAGDFDPARALELVNRYFADAVPSGSPRPAMAAPEPEAQAGRATVEDHNARTPGVLLGFPIPASRTPEHYALELAAVMLGGGESSRLYRTLVHERAEAEQVSASTDDHRGPDELTVSAVLTEKANVRAVEADIDTALARLRTTPPTEAELERAKQRVRTGMLFGIQTNLDRAIALGEFEALYGDASLLPQELERYLAVRPEDVRRAAARYLVPAHRSLVEVVPGGKEHQS
jgi:predicted Zn-dependent peptidase